MGKKRGGKNQDNYNSVQVHTSLTLGEEARGKKQSHNVKSVLTVKHLEKLAVWASGVASVPSLGAFLGHKLADASEKLAVPVDPSLITCQRCETILQPGFNCTIRIEKNHVKPKWLKKNSFIPTKNNVVYTCHFCSYRNVKRGTSKGHMKEICPPNSKLHVKQEAANHKHKKWPSSEKSTNGEVKVDKSVEISSPAISHVAAMDSPATLVKTDVPLLLDSKRRMRKKAWSGKVVESEDNSAKTDASNCSGTSKRRRKSFTSLKEIAENKERERIQKVANFSIPFALGSLLPKTTEPRVRGNGRW